MQYESFWQDPAAASFAWIGLLFSIMCLSTQQQLAEDPTDPNTLMRVYTFRERTVHCLVLGQFTKGGTHMLETMINNLASEAIQCKDTNIELWFLLGMVVQLSISLGSHRDPRNFPNISIFAGEMRRRVWAAIVQMDLRLSSQLGLPHLLKSQQCDTAEPRNLLDSDFDEATVELPPSRPETEVTLVLYGLAKNRIDRISGLISDIIADTRSHPYTEIMDLDEKLHEAEASLPPIFQWQPLGESFMVPPQIILYRVWLQVAVQRLVIWLHRKYLAPSYTQAQYQYSRNSCVQAAMKLLEFQQLLDEETLPDGQLHSVCWMQSSLIQPTFLLGMSVLCYYTQLAKTTPDVPLDQDTGARIFNLLRNTYSIWQRSSTISQDAWEAVEHLSLLPGLRSHPEDAPLAQEARAHLVTPQDAATTLDQATWDVYQGKNDL
jgi:Fungal specific transcription factor domain